MTPFITEILAEINTTPALLGTKHKDNTAVRMLLEYAFDASKKFVLPEGDPPFKPDAAPIGMSPANFYQQIRKLYIFTRVDLSSTRREALFIQMLESIHPSEAKVCLLIKDQNLTAEYPNITADLVAKEGIVQRADLFRTDASAVVADEPAPAVEAPEADVAQDVAQDVAGQSTEPTAPTKGKHLVVGLQHAVTTKESFGPNPSATPVAPAKVVTTKAAPAKTPVKAPAKAPAKAKTPAKVPTKAPAKKVVTKK